jgi:hypothetical protein
MPTISKSQASADSLAKWARKALARSGRSEIDTRLTTAHGRRDKTKPTMGAAACVGFCSTALPRFHLHLMRLRCGQLSRSPIKEAVATIKVEAQDNLAAGQ